MQDKRMDLIKNENVIFNEDNHTYTLLKDDFSTELLSGVTKMIGKYICPDMYRDVDEATLMKAAEHGSRCHKVCELFDNGELKCEDGVYIDKDGVVIDEGLEELNEYRRLCEENDLIAEASEYLVSDNEHFASCIDKVLREGPREFSILDFKFTYNYHEEPVTWQTSIYADMLERQNPKAKVKNLYCMHIKFYFEKDENGAYVKGDNGRPKQKKKPTIGLHKLKRVPTEVCDELMRCYVNDLPFENPLAKKEAELGLTEERQTEINEVLKNAAEWEKKKKEVMEELKSLFEASPDTSKFKGVYFAVSQSAASHSVVFDEEALKKEMPEVWKKYCTKVKVVSGRTTVKFNK